VPDLCECLPISLILTGYCHIYYATDCYRDTSAVYIKLQSLIPMLCHTINRGDINRSTTSTAATLHYWTDLFFADVPLITSSIVNDALICIVGMLSYVTPLARFGVHLVCQWSLI